MNIQKSKELGHYVTSFFDLYLNIDIDDIRNISLEKDLVVLFHEYMHFLQDFTTYYGLNAIYVHAEYIRSVVNRIYKGPSKFIVPYEINDNDDNVLLNKQILKYTLAIESSEIPSLNIKKIQLLPDILIKNPYFDSIDSIALFLEDDNIVSFGALAIMESMAYIMERCCAPNEYEKSQEYPYQSAEKVADFYVPGFSSNLLNVLALCDISLQTSNPASYFVNTMKDIKDGRLHFNTPESIYDHLYSTKFKIIASDNDVPFIDCFKMQVEYVRESLKAYFKNLPITEIYYKWVDKLLNFAINWRENYRYFLLEMAKYDNNLSVNPYWGKIIANVGTPLMYINNGKYFNIPIKNVNSDEVIIYVKALCEIENLFREGACKCSMYNFCRCSSSSSVNKFCETAPWRKVFEKELCYYAIIWKHFGLSKFVPIKKTNSK